MPYDEARVRELALSYTEAWCSHDPARVAAHFVPGGTIAINGGEATEITAVARSFIDEFPDIEVFMDDVVFKDATVEYHWTFTGTSTGTGRAVRISGFEEWTLGEEVSSSSRRGATTPPSTPASSSTGRPLDRPARARQLARHSAQFGPLASSGSPCAG